MRVTFPRLSELQGMPWENARSILVEELQRLKSTINTTWDVSHHADGTQRGPTEAQIFGRFVGTLAEQPTSLTTEDDGLLFFVTDYGHLVRWDGSTLTWKFAPGDCGNGFFRDFAITPQENGWALCDGSSVTYLVVGGSSLTTSSITLPDLSGTAAYKKSGSYTGSIVAAGGSTADESSHTHSTSDHSHTLPNTDSSSPGTDSQGAHTHSDGTGGIAVPGGTQVGSAWWSSGNSSSNGSHSHTVDAHDHSFSSNTGNAGAGSTGAGSAHHHSIGTLDPAHLAVLPYFRR